MGLGVLALLEAKEGKGEELGSLLLEGLPMAEAEEGTVRWYAFKISETRYGALDVFESEEGRQAHLSGEMAERLREVGGDLLAAPPSIQPIDIIAQK